MAIKLPEAVKPVLNLVFHVIIGASLFAAIVLVEVMLAGVLKALALIPFAPHWLDRITDVVERALFAFDLCVAGLFLIAEAIKFVRGLWNGVRLG